MVEKKGAAKIENVKVKDIVPNHFRDPKVYPILEYKVAKLMKSINKGGLWENVIGRKKKDGKVEIAYGHHRVEAAGRIYKPDDTVALIIKDLTDDDMFNMMVHENDEDYRCHPASIDACVKASRDRLEAHPEETRKALSSVRSEVKRARVGAPAIAEDTGYSETTVERSLQRLGMIKRGEVDAEALHKMPHQQAAMRFAKAVLDSRSKPNVEDQRKVAEHLVKEDKFGEASINYAFKEFLPAVKKNDPRYPGYYNNLLHKARGQIDALIETLRRIEKRSSYKDAPTMEDVSQLTMHSYNQAVYRLAEKIMDMAGLVDEGLPRIVDGGPPVEREPNLADVLQLELFLLKFFNQEMSKEYEFTCTWDREKRTPVVTSIKRPWPEAAKREEAERAEVAKAKTKKLAMEREQFKAKIEKANARLKESAQKKETGKDGA